MEKWGARQRQPSGARRHTLLVDVECRRAPVIIMRVERAGLRAPVGPSLSCARCTLARRRKEAEGRAYEERAGARDVRRDWRRQPGALATLFRVADLQQDLYGQRIM